MGRGRGLLCYYCSMILLAIQLIVCSIIFYVQELNYAWSCQSTGYPVFCEVHAVVYMAGQYTSPTLVLGFTVERYIAICHPFRKERYCTPSVAARVSAAMVIFCLVIASAQVGPC